MAIERNNNPSDFTALPTAGAEQPKTYQPIMAPQSSGGGFGSGAMGGAAAGAGIGAGIGAFAGGIGAAPGALIGAGVGATIGFIGDLANLWISGSAAMKQEDQTRELNAKSKLQFDNEQAESTRRFDEQMAANNKATDWNNYKDRETMVTNWSSSFFAMANQDQNMKNALVNLWRSAQ